MYEKEEVDENEAKNLAEELNAIFQRTSAMNSEGIDDLFIKIGEKFINQKSDGQRKTPEKTGSQDNIILNKKNGGGKQKKKCY